MLVFVTWHHLVWITLVMTERKNLAMKKALVVDDNNVNRYLLNALLKRYGYQVIEATNGQEAIEKHLEHQPNIIFMDLMMPVMEVMIF